ncbi:TetR/AcrR family transcriptional regulator [Ornithinicoccus halotolerans]|uniref:TetR/AcrR family transcriptional regulator n=1 Tax=Ornithinicoccus halotolerans TaxID=1748220 RepID=UPI001885DBC6|nr:TetR/AcrR family transcriptional regulator [Ornithinicoccus halotolerans]
MTAVLPEQPGRRERNKARTREAIVAATRALARERGLEQVTVAQIADRAEISRRTFFNYFGGVDEVVAAGTATTLQALGDAFLARPATEDPLAAVAAALREHPLDRELLLDWRPAGQLPEHRLHPLHHQVWRHHEEWLVQLLARRVGDADPLRPRTLAAALMAFFEVVERAWAPRTVDLDADEAVAVFNADLLRALDHARSGWRPLTR